MASKNRQQRQAAWRASQKTQELVNTAAALAAKQNLGNGKITDRGPITMSDAAQKTSYQKIAQRNSSYSTQAAYYAKWPLAARECPMFVGSIETYAENKPDHLLAGVSRPILAGMPIRYDSAGIETHDPAGMPNWVQDRAAWQKKRDAWELDLLGNQIPEDDSGFYVFPTHELITSWHAYVLACEEGDRAVALLAANNFKKIDRTNRFSMASTLILETRINDVWYAAKALQESEAAYTASVKREEAAKTAGKHTTAMAESKAAKYTDMIRAAWIFHNRWESLHGSNAAAQPEDHTAAVENTIMAVVAAHHGTAAQAAMYASNAAQAAQEAAQGAIGGAAQEAAAESPKTAAQEAAQAAQAAQEAAAAAAAAKAAAARKAKDAAKAAKDAAKVTAMHPAAAAKTAARKQEEAAAAQAAQEAAKA